MTHTPMASPRHVVLLALLAFALVSIAPRVTAQEPAPRRPPRRRC
jgi:hypothetical protein